MKGPELRLLPPSQRTTAQELAIALKTLHNSDLDPALYSTRQLLVDVRGEEEFAMCHLDGTVSCPLDALHGSRLTYLLRLVRRCTGQVTVMCRRGNDSQIAVTRLLEVLEEEHRGKVKDLVGGLHAWAKHVDHTFPVY